MGFFISDIGRSGQLNFGARPGFAPEIQLRSDLLRTFTDSGQPPVPRAATLLQNFLINTLSIVAYEHAEQTAIVADLSFYLTRTRMVKGILQKFTTHAIDLVLEGTRQFPAFSFYNHLKERRIAISISRGQLLAKGRE